MATMHAGRLRCTQTNSIRTTGLCTQLPPHIVPEKPIIYAQLQPAEFGTECCVGLPSCRLPNARKAENAYNTDMLRSEDVAGWAVMYAGKFTILTTDLFQIILHYSTGHLMVKKTATVCTTMSSQAIQMSTKGE
jgi:hypothetical protein